ncbi:hypothetical protein QFZ55_000054 [Streptomyces luteogriseus]|nr:hypothetical protein [Streptomyces luteogriseus]
MNPGRSIPTGASEIHDITDEAVASAPTFGQILVGLTAALDGRRCLTAWSGVPLAPDHGQLAARARSQAEVEAHGRAVVAGVHAHQVGHVVDQH